MKIYTLALLLLICAFHANGQYITVWKTDNPGTSANNQIIIPATGTNYHIEWQEINNPENSSSEIGSGYHTLTFPSAGKYLVTITVESGSFTRISFGPGSDSHKLMEIRQWGNIEWENMADAYSYCGNLKITATDMPDLQNVKSMARMFYTCTVLSNVPGINNWNVSAVTNMQSMFAYTDVFNDPIGSWDVSNVTNMNLMFYGSRFNQPIGAWNVAKLTDMSSMFQNTLNFNQPIGTWDVSSVTNMRSTFYEANAYNQPLDDWDVSNVTDMSFMFNRATAFNQPIGSWDVSSVKNMSNMFRFTKSFNQPIDSWDVSQVTNMEYMFESSNAFNQPISSWNVGNVTNMSDMFRDTRTFNQPIGSWDVSNVTNMSFMFYGAVAFNQPVNDLDVRKVSNLLYMFYFTPAFNQSLSKWTILPRVSMNSLLTRSGIDCANMALTLQGWAANTAMPHNITFSAEGIAYGLSAAAALETLRVSKNWNISIGSGVVCDGLEVSLVSFNAKTTGGIVKLEWATASETDNDYFEIERSADARSWNPVGRIKGAGTVKSIQNYSFTDTSPLEGNSYYRLKIVDLTEKADYSNIRAVNVKINPFPSIYPNPATTSLTLSGKANGAVEVYNLSGQKVLQTQIRNEKMTIPLSGLPAGPYVIKSDDGWNSKFIKN